MGVELDAGPADGHREEELTTWRKNSLELRSGLECSVRVQRIPVAAKAYVLSDVEARQRRDGSVSEG